MKLEIGTGQPVANPLFALRSEYARFEWRHAPFIAAREDGD
jgi:hypothetical protein